jgi:chaperonin GroES
MSQVPIAPLGERVVAVREETASKTASGLYLPENAKEKSQIAKVVAVGRDVTNLKSGDRIVFKEYSTTDLKINDVEYIILKVEDVLATVN